MANPGLITTIVIFGGSGDLTWRKLVPALYNNFLKGRLTDCTHIIGFARRPYTDDEFRNHLKEGVTSFSAETFQESTWTEFSNRITYFHGDLQILADHSRLKDAMATLEKGPANRLYYLATAPEFYRPAIENLGATGLAVQSQGWRDFLAGNGSVEKGTFPVIG